MDDALELHRQALEIQIAKEMRLVHQDPTSTWGIFFIKHGDIGTHWRCMEMWRNYWTQKRSEFDGCPSSIGINLLEMGELDRARIMQWLHTTGQGQWIGCTSC